MSSIKEVLNDAEHMLRTHSDSATLDAEVLLCFTLSKQRSYLRTWPDLELLNEHKAHFFKLIQTRQKGLPIAYITGHKEFWSRDFIITHDVLIPRPDTELMIEICLQLIPNNTTQQIIDLGTGSGIIAITLAAERPHLQMNACDSSLAALDVAKLNADKNNTLINFYQSNWFSNIPPSKFNFIVSNPPYIAEHDEHLLQGDLRFEPLSALQAKAQGLSDIKIITDTARDYLAPEGYLLIEHGFDQQQSVQQIFNDFHYKTVQTAYDLSGLPRVTYGQCP